MGYISANLNTHHSSKTNGTAILTEFIIKAESFTIERQRSSLFDINNSISPEEK